MVQRVTRCKNSLFKKACVLFKQQNFSKRMGKMDLGGGGARAKQPLKEEEEEEEKSVKGF